MRKINYIIIHCIATTHPSLAHLLTFTRIYSLATEEMCLFMKA